MTIKASFNTIVRKARGRVVDVIEEVAGVPVHRMRVPPLLRVFRHLTRPSSIPQGGQLVKVSLEGHELHVPWDTLDSYAGKAYEPTTVRLFKESLRPGATVLDIGAHVGFYSLLAARAVGPRGRVLSFEPAPSNFKALQLNIQTNGYTNITPIQKAVGSEEGTRAFYLSEKSDCQGLTPHHLAATTTVCPVDCTTIDAFLRGQAVDLVKMDIEGSEPAAIAGMRATIAGSPNLTLFTEFNPPCLRRAGYEPGEYLDLLMQIGFHVEVVDKESQDVKPVTGHLAFPKDDPRWFVNLICRKGAASDSPVADAGTP